VPLQRCSECTRRTGEKTTHTTIAWRTGDDERVAYLLHLCGQCFGARVGSQWRDYQGVERLTCPACGIDTEDDHDDVYVTAYIPSYGEFKLEVPFCGACAALYRIWAQEHGQRRESQLGASTGPQTHPTGLELLRSMGIEPRAQ
jgi:hypothetical protein